MRNDMFIIFSQQINFKWQTVIDENKSNNDCRLNLKLITICHIKLIYCENVISL